MKNQLLSFIISILVCFIFIVNLIIPSKQYSSFENRYLASFPKATFDSILNNEFSLDMEEYVNDQFILRNQWITLKSTIEMLMNKQENNSIYLGKDHFLFEKMIQEDEQLKANTQTMNNFLEMFKQNNIKIAMPLSSYMIYPQYLPKHAPTFNQQQWISKHATLWPMIDVSTDLQEQQKLMYYKNDHHWTLDGAFIAYQNIMKAYNMNPLNQVEFSTYEEEAFLGSYFAKAKPVNYEYDLFKYINPAIKSYSFNKEIKDSLIDNKQLDQRDKYAAFLYGNPGYAKIVVNENDNPSRILVIKDSYANSVIPFLTAHYDEIDVIDLRNFNGSIRDFISKNKFESILFLHSFSQFASDRSISKLNY